MAETNKKNRLADGTMKRLVSIVDRAPIDNYLYPASSTDTLFQPKYQDYHQFSSEILESSYKGNAAWGQRITFEMPENHTGDFLQWCALVIRPGTWVPSSIIPKLTHDNNHCYQPMDIPNSWIWAAYLGQIAIESAELEVEGLVIDRIDGDWCAISSAIHLSREQATAWADSITGPQLTPRRGVPFRRHFMIQPTEDGSVWCYLPFWFARRRNAALPICSLTKKNVKIHITLRPFSEVVRRWSNARKTVDEVPLKETVRYQDFSKRYPFFLNVANESNVPAFTGASMYFGISYIADPLRSAYIERPHEVLIEQIITMRFAEPLKYSIPSASLDTILVSLPLTGLNNPLRRLFFFVRRKATWRYNEWTNYGSLLEDEVDSIYNPQRPLLKRAKLLVGTVILADQPENWWRYTSGKSLPGSAAMYDNYIYCISFDGDTDSFGPQGGTINASRADIRLDLEVVPPAPNAIDSSITTEWEVVVFGLTYNWLRFENGIANLVFSD